jgi:hypothetical protein
MEAIYKFHLSGTIFHKLRYSPSDDVSESFALLLNTNDKILLLPQYL